MQRSFAAFCSLAFLMHPLMGMAANPVCTDPQEADRDYAIQGEYAGTILLDGGEVPVGVQVIARGDGRFDVVAYPGGLPGVGWDGGDYLSGSGRRVDDDAVEVEVMDSNGVRHKAEIRDGVLNAQGPDGAGAAKFLRVERKSPTLGQEPPANAVVIFDGEGPADESITLEGARITPDGLLVEGVVTTEEYGDGRWHIEFRLPYQPLDEGQERGNSGVYVGGCYEVQVLDSFGLEGRNNECGGIYSAAAPLVNMCFPPLTWQTYDIDFTAPRFEGDRKISDARMTVRHNGVVIHENVALRSLTPGGTKQKEGPTGPLFLQDHTNPVRFRNIWFEPALGAN
jgi:hypothetical protein